MRKTEFDGVVKEDLERFTDLLMDFYDLPWEESYARLTKDIETRFLHRQRDTNPRYRSHFETNLKDLVIAVVGRFVRINAKLQATGKKIDNFYAMLETRIDHVYKEELRKIGRIVDFDDLNVPAETNSVYAEIESEETSALRLGCQQKCFARLRADVAAILMEYYDTDGLSPKERTYKRQQMALRLSNLPSSGATPEETTAARKNLDSRISKLRSKHLKPCMEKCLKNQRFH